MNHNHRCEIHQGKPCTCRESPAAKESLRERMRKQRAESPRPYGKEKKCN